MKHSQNFSHSLSLLFYAFYFLPTTSRQRFPLTEKKRIFLADYRKTTTSPLVWLPFRKAKAKWTISYHCWNQWFLTKTEYICGSVCCLNGISVIVFVCNSSSCVHCICKDNKIFVDFNSALQKGTLIFTCFQLAIGRLFEALMGHKSYYRSCCRPLTVQILVRIIFKEMSYDYVLLHELWDEC